MSAESNSTEEEYVTVAPTTIGFGAAFAFGFINLSIYTWVVVSVIRYFKDFSNPFYKCLLSLAVCDIYIIWHLNIYAPICWWAQRWVFGAIVDSVLSLLEIGLSYVAQLFQILIALNRFCGVVFFSQYKQLFRNRNLYLAIAACFAFGLFVDTVVVIKADAVVLDLFHGVPTILGEYSNFHYEVFEFLLMIVVCFFLVLFYGLSAVFFWKRKSTVVNQGALSMEVKLLLIGAINAVFFFFGYISFLVIAEVVPLWLLFQIYSSYVWASPYLYLIFDKKLREKALNKSSNSVVPFRSTKIQSKKRF